MVEFSALAKQKPELIKDEKFLQALAEVISEPYSIDIYDTEPTDVDTI